MGAASQQRAIPIVVFAIDPRAPMFHEYTSTVSVAPQEALIRLRHEVEAGSTLFILNRDANTEAEFVVEATTAPGEVRVTPRHQVDIWRLGVKPNGRNGSSAPDVSAAPAPADQPEPASAETVEALSRADQAFSAAGQSREQATVALAQAESLKSDVVALADEARVAAGEVTELGRRAAELRSEADAALRWIENLRGARQKAGHRLVQARRQLEAAENAVAEARVSIALTLQMLSEMKPMLSRAAAEAGSVAQILTSPAPVASAMPVASAATGASSAPAERPSTEIKVAPAPGSIPAAEGSQILASPAVVANVAAVASPAMQQVNVASEQRQEAPVDVAPAAPPAAVGAAPPQVEPTASGTASVDVIAAAPRIERVASPPMTRSGVVKAALVAAAKLAVEAMRPARENSPATKRDEYASGARGGNGAGDIGGAATPPVEHSYSSIMTAAPARPALVPARPSVADPRFLTGPLNRSDRRLSRRVQVRTRARIRRGNLAEVVVPIDVSRTGLGFHSAGAYEMKEPIWVAMHYREDDIDLIEIAARVVRLAPGENGHPPQYGVRFEG